MHIYSSISGTTYPTLERQLVELSHRYIRPFNDFITKTEFLVVDVNSMMTYLS